MTEARTFTVWLTVSRFNEADRRWYYAGWSTEDRIEAATADEAAEKATAAWQKKQPDRRFTLIDVREEN